MKSFKIVLKCLVPFILLNFLFSCKDEYEPDYEYYLIRIDSIQMPVNIAQTDSFDIKFYGTVGPNGCYQFLQIITEVQENSLMVKVWGKYDKNANNCPAEMVYLEGEKINIMVKEKNIDSIKVQQPDDNYLEEPIPYVDYRLEFTGAYEGTHEHSYSFGPMGMGGSGNSTFQDTFVVELSEVDSFLIVTNSRIKNVLKFSEAGICDYWEYVEHIYVEFEDDGMYYSKAYQGGTEKIFDKFTGGKINND